MRLGSTTSSILRPSLGASLTISQMDWGGWPGGRSPPPKEGVPSPAQRPISRAWGTAGHGGRIWAADLDRESWGGGNHTQGLGGTGPGCKYTHRQNRGTKQESLAEHPAKLVGRRARTTPNAGVGAGLELSGVNESSRGLGKN